MHRRGVAVMRRGPYLTVCRASCLGFACLGIIMLLSAPDSLAAEQPRSQGTSPISPLHSSCLMAD